MRIANKIEFIMIVLSYYLRYRRTIALILLDSNIKA